MLHRRRKRRQKSTRRPSRRPRFGRIEPLESRRVLAGNVPANLYGSTLLILGDEAGNDLVIERMGEAVQLSSGADATSITTQGDLTAVRSLELRRGAAMTA